MAERQFGPYRLIRQIAVGGMAEIHLAKTKGIAGFEKYVALKMIHPNFAEDDQFIQMLVDEAKIAVQLTHGNIAQTFDLGRVGDTYYITMEFVDGADLYKILRKGSEMDLEFPLDTAAFIAKEVASALDHAHRKRDHAGKALGIVHRDVSPQNVLVSYAGEIKLVDFGIAKATMKARQTAVGVIKGKYYYMSPEQARADPIDFRSDIFSAGIVLYEMITGQMLYLEEDLHQLLEMVRRADIAPPSTLRRGIPPQLEKIVMHALEKVPGDRYQSAGDFASDLERFLHSYSPVFTAAKVSGLLKKVVGEPHHGPAPQDERIEMDVGLNATFTLDTNDLVHDGGELRDENSVLFKLDALVPTNEPKVQARPQPVVKPTVPAKLAPVAPRPALAKPIAPARAPGNLTRATAPTEPPPIASEGTLRPPIGNVGAAIPSITKRSGPRDAHKPTRPSSLRKHDEETRQLESGAPMGGDESGLLMPYGGRVEPPEAAWESRDADSGLDKVDDRTMITVPPDALTRPTNLGFMMDGDDNLDGVDATMVTSAPPHPEPESEPLSHDTSDDELATMRGEDEMPTTPSRDHDPTEQFANDDEPPTLTRDFRVVARQSGVARKGPPPAALAARIHAPAVSELRRPRPSKRTPQGGVSAQPNVLQQIVSRQANEPMPVPRPPDRPAQQAPPQSPYATPGAAPTATGYATDASGMPMNVPTQVDPASYPPGQAPHYQPYAQQGYPPRYLQPAQPAQQGGPPGESPNYPNPYPRQQVTPNALYQFHPAPQPMSLTGQLRLFEVDELPSHYNLSAQRSRWFTYIVAGVIAVSVAAIATFLIIRTTRDSAPTIGSVHIESVPSGAEVEFDGQRQAGTTPLTIPGVPVGTRHDVVITLKRHKPFRDTVDISRNGGEIPVSAVLEAVTGKLTIISQPDGAEIWINDQVRGVTPKVLEGVDMEATKRLELRLKDYAPYSEPLVWPDNGQLAIDAKLKH